MSICLNYIISLCHYLCWEVWNKILGNAIGNIANDQKSVHRDIEVTTKSKEMSYITLHICTYSTTFLSLEYHKHKEHPEISQNE